MDRCDVREQDWYRSHLDAMDEYSTVWIAGRQVHTTTPTRTDTPRMFYQLG
jgi:hypothetical protein